MKWDGTGRKALPFNGERAQIAGTYTTGQEQPVVDPDLFKVSEGPAHPVLEIRGRPGLENYFPHFSAISLSLGSLKRLGTIW